MTWISKILSKFRPKRQNFDQFCKIPEKFLQNCLPNSDLAENRFSQNDERDPKIENFVAFGQN